MGVYSVLMPVNITKFRLNLFQMADEALEGKPIEFIHKGVVFKVVPSTPVPKLSRLPKETVVAPMMESTDFLKEMEAEWESDWSEL